MNEGEKRSFWQFNLGHFLTIATMLVGAVGLYVQRERDLAILHTKSASQAITLAENAQVLAELPGRLATQLETRTQLLSATIEARTLPFVTLPQRIAWLERTVDQRGVALERNSEVVAQLNIAITKLTALAENQQGQLARQQTQLDRQQTQIEQILNRGRQ